MGKPLPALEAEGLISQVQWPPVDKEHPPVRPFHRHVVKDGKEWRIPYLFMTVHACRIAPAHENPVQERMIMVAEDRPEFIFMREGMDHFQCFTGAVSAMNKVPEINQDINRPTSAE